MARAGFPLHPPLSAALRDGTAAAAAPDDPLSDEQALALRKRAIVEVAARTRAGFFAYPLLWLLAMQGSDFMDRHRGFVLAHALGLGLVGLVRMACSRRLAERLEQDFDRTRRIFQDVTLLHGLYWGGLLAVCMAVQDQTFLRQLVVPITVALVITGAMMMAIDDWLGRAYPPAVLVPPVVVMLALSLPNAPAYALGALCLTAYGWLMTRLFRRDYLRGEHARLLLEARARDLEALSLTDALTGARNRLYVDRHLPDLWRDGRRQRQPISVALVDLDHFKRVNDTHGHAVGDACLRQAAQVLSDELLRPTDVVARYGGEEFLLVLPDTDEAGALTVAQRVLARMRSQGVQVKGGQGEEVIVTCSIGLCTTVPTADSGHEQLIQRADEALYRAKAQGRDRSVALPAG